VTQNKVRSCRKCRLSLLDRYYSAENLGFFMMLHAKNDKKTANVLQTAELLKNNIGTFLEARYNALF